MFSRKGAKDAKEKIIYRHLLFLVIALLLFCFAGKELFAEVNFECGGHVKLRGSVSWPDDESFYDLIGTDPYYDGSAELRTKAKLFLNQSAYGEIHYEMIYLGGDTRRKTNNLTSLFSDLGVVRGIGVFPLDDDRRLFDLSKVIHDTDSSALYPPPGPTLAHSFASMGLDSYRQAGGYLGQWLDLQPHGSL